MVLTKKQKMKEYGIINLQIKCIHVCMSVCHGITIQEGFDVRTTVYCCSQL